MNEAVNRTFFMKYESEANKKSRSLSKDLFSQKLGQSIKFNTSIYKKRMPSLNITKFKTNIPKNNTNILLSIEKDDDISNIITKLNNPVLPKLKFFNHENNKQMLNNRSLLNTYNTNVKYNKKQIKEILDLKQNKLEKKIDNINYNKEREKEKHSMMEIENIKTRRMIDVMSQINSQKQLNKKEISKEAFGGYRRINKKSTQIQVKRSKSRSRSKNNTKESINISVLSTNKNVEVKNKENSEKNNEKKIEEYKSKDIKDNIKKNKINEENKNKEKENKDKDNGDKDNKNKTDNNKEDKNTVNKINEEFKNIKKDTIKKDIDKKEIDNKDKNIEDKEKDKGKKNIDINIKDKEIKDKEIKDNKTKDNKDNKENKDKCILEKEDKDSIIFLTHFYEDFIELVRTYDSIGKYSCSINNFNQTYIFLFDIKAFPKTTMNIQFLDTFKYTSILSICLIFLTKDEKLYKPTVSKIKDLLKNFLLICMQSINYKLFETEKIKNFIKRNSSNQQYKTLIEIINQIINLLFNDKMNDYKKLRKCLRQLVNNINNDTPEKILNIVNNSILYCHNCKYYIEESDYKRKKKKKQKSKKNIKEEDEKSSTSNIQSPYIKTKMEKKYCLVLDLDETLMHNLNLPFGPYFFVRPGLFELFEKIHDIYEIIIFTASKKNYAYSIIDRIDYKNYISHILHKKYIIYENGVAVKKLDLIGRDLNKLIFVDNLETCAKYNKNNFYSISSWYNNVYDNELYKLQEKLIYFATSGKCDDDITKGLLEK